MKRLDHLQSQLDVIAETTAWVWIQKAEKEVFIQNRGNAESRKTWNLKARKRKETRAKTL